MTFLFLFFSMWLRCSYFITPIWGTWSDSYLPNGITFEMVAMLENLGFIAAPYVVVVQ